MNSNVDSKTKDRLTALVVSGAFFVMFLLGSAVLNWVAIQPTLNARKAKSWVQTPCKILEMKYESHSGSSSRSSKGSAGYKPVVRFEYTYQGNNYESGQFWLDQALVNTYKEIRTLISAYEVGKEYSCYVDPNEPSQAVLKRGLYHSPIKIWVLGSIFPIVGAIGTVAGIVAFFKIK
ncbi:MAG: DUF3592 domain-containing protein [Planctomycetes bacterium]|nr:DUF3592 domain-containing protein [Planctomycetota bacterium]